MSAIIIILAIIDNNFCLINFGCGSRSIINKFNSFKFLRNRQEAFQQSAVHKFVDWCEYYFNILEALKQMQTQDSELGHRQFHQNQKLNKCSHLKISKNSSLPDTKQHDLQVLSIHKNNLQLPNWKVEHKDFADLDELSISDVESNKSNEEGVPPCHSSSQTGSEQDSEALMFEGGAAASSVLSKDRENGDAVQYRQDDDDASGMNNFDIINEEEAAEARNRCGGMTGQSNDTNQSGGLTSNQTNQLTELQKQKEALKQFILGVKTDSGSATAARKKRERELRQISHFLIDKTLGEGTFGKVKLGIHTITQEKVAIKILEKNKIQDQTDIDRIAREIKILKKIRHPRVIQLYQIIETECELYLIMEHANAGELFDYIVRNDRVDDINAAKFFHQILEGVQHLHELGVCHRDLKPENLLLEKGKHNIKIIDFGLSNMYQNAQDTLKTACGSPCYAAPEMIAGKDYKGLQVDIWSCGVILYAMLCGYLPFEDPNTDKLYKKILDCDYSIPNYVSESGRNLISKILNTNPEERYTIQQIRSHPWFIKNFDKSKKSEPDSPSLLALDIFSQKTQISDHISTNTIQQNNKNQANQEIKINPQLVIDIIEKHKIPLNPTKQHSQQDSKTNLEDPSTYERFTVETVLKSLAHNKHNDSTTTYYLLHKKWLAEIEEKHNLNGGKSMRISSNLRSSEGTSGMSSSQLQMQQNSKQKIITQEATSQLITLSTANCEQIIYKIKNMMEAQLNNAGDKKSPTQRAKNMIKIKDDKQKLIESASLVIKSPAGPALGGRFNRESGQTNNSKVREIVQKDVRGTKRIQVVSNHESDVKSNKHQQTFSMTNSNVTPNKNMPSEKSSRERRVNKVDKNNNRRIDSVQKKKENLTIYPYENIKVKTTRKNEQMESSLTPNITSKAAQKMGLNPDAYHDDLNSNSHLSHSQITNNQDYTSKNVGNFTQNIEINSSKASQNPNNINSYNSAVHSKKQSGISSQKTGPGQGGGYRDNSGFANEILNQTHTPNPKKHSFKQTSSPTQRGKSTRRQTAFNPHGGDVNPPRMAIKIPVLEKTLGVASMNKRYKSQQRGAKETYNFKSGVNATSKFNNYLRDRSDDKQKRHSSRGVSAVSRISKVSGTNVSYQSNLSVIRQNIHRFKHNKSPKKKENQHNTNHTSINLSKNTVSSFMGLQIPRKQDNSIIVSTAIVNTSRISKATESKKTARMSMNPKQQASNQPTKSALKKKELNLNLGKVQTPMSGAKHGKPSMNTVSYGKSPIKNYGNVTTRNQQINKFNTSNLMVGNSHQHSSSQSQHRQSVSKKQQNIKQLIGYGTKATKTFNQKNSISGNKVLNYGKYEQLDVPSTPDLASKPKYPKANYSSNQVRDNFSKRTVNIDLDALTQTNDTGKINPGLMSNSQTPLAVNSKHFAFNETTNTDSMYKKDSRQYMSIQNPNKYDHSDRPDDISDNLMEDGHQASEMPNEYSNLTQGYEMLAYSTQQQAANDLNNNSQADYDLTQSYNFQDNSYRRSFMKQTKKQGNMSAQRNRDYNNDTQKSSRKTSQNRAGQAGDGTSTKGKNSNVQKSFITNSRLSAQNSRADVEKSQIDRKFVEAGLPVLSTPSQSINLNQYQISAMNTPNADHQNNSSKYKASFKSGSVFVHTELMNPSQGAYMKMNKGSISITENMAKLQQKNHISAYEKQVQQHKFSTSQHQQKGKGSSNYQTAPKTGNSSNAPASSKSKQANPKGAPHQSLQLNNIRASYGGGSGQQSSRPGTSHRAVASSNYYNTVSGQSTKNSHQKTTNFANKGGASDQPMGSPSRLSSRKKNLVE